MVKEKGQVDQATLNPSQQTPYLDIDSKADKDTKAEILQGKAVVLLDPTANPIKTFGSVNPLNIQISSGTQASTKVGAAGTGQDISAGAVALYTFADILLWNKAANTLENQRTPTIFTDGTWTPAAGKKARIMAFDITAVVTVAGTITLLDGATVLKTFQVGTGNFYYRGVMPGNGHLSAAINNAQSLSGTATATSNVAFEGTEE